MKIFDQIKELSIEDMALMLCQSEVTCSDCIFRNDKTKCLTEIAQYMEWLESEEELFEVTLEDIGDEIKKSNFDGLTFNVKFDPDMDAIREILIDGLKICS